MGTSSPPHPESPGRRRLTGLPIMSDRRPFGPWTLAVAICWVTATILAIILVWRLWTNMPRG